ncbi:protein DA1 [Parabacteroides segnis]|uniref:protein DA1 n=1 Tax=Parabacteroides segnis TaxID=2763058 RepID=UPI003518C35F
MSLIEVSVSMVYLESSDKILNQLVGLADNDLFNKAIDRALQLLDNVGIFADKNRIRFELVTREKMDTHGTSYVGLHFNLGFCSKIWVVENHSLLYTISVLAHEIGHAWICQNKINVTEVENEGFCQVLSYYVLSTEFSKDGNREADLVRNFADEVYGDGFRLMQRKLDCLGWKQFVMLLRF